MGEKQKKSIFKRWWFWVIVVIVIFAIGSSGNDVDIPKETASDEKPSQIEQKNDETKVEETNKTDEVEKPEESAEETEENIPKEYQSALKKAHVYANEMHMSKASLYDQLVSEYGENFSEEAAQYAVDNVEADWKENALQKAILYQDEMAMSPNAIYEQLISEHGEQFTEEEAQYAIDNLPE